MKKLLLTVFIFFLLAGITHNTSRSSPLSTKIGNWDQSGYYIWNFTDFKVQFNLYSWHDDKREWFITIYPDNTIKLSEIVELGWVRKPWSFYYLGLEYPLVWYASEDGFVYGSNTP